MAQLAILVDLKTPYQPTLPTTISIVLYNPCEA